MTGRALYRAGLLGWLITLALFAWLCARVDAPLALALSPLWLAPLLYLALELVFVAACFAIAAALLLFASCADILGRLLKAAR